jgi:hypothetical protein
MARDNTIHSRSNYRHPPTIARLSLSYHTSCWQEIKSFMAGSMRRSTRTACQRELLQRKTFLEFCSSRRLVWLPLLLCSMLITTTDSIPLLEKRFNTTTNVTGM